MAINNLYDNLVRHIYADRVCPGMHVATRSLLITTGNLLWTFNIAKARESNVEIDIDTLGFTNTANSHPLPFRAAFHERFPGANNTQLQLEGF
jgi:hypothetical protein